jgi:2-polyprenyl-3-methyl-5-hydroxy-6-metoxy-1,4-benzoquinol methylase
MLDSVKRTLRKSYPKLYGDWVRYCSRSFPAKVSRILADPTPPRTLGSKEFDLLQSQYTQWWPNYGYDDYSKWQRGVERAIELIGTYDLQVPGQSILEVACGDGMTGIAIASYGHRVELIDIEDWRDPRAKSLDFRLGDVCIESGLGGSDYDFIYSFNAFEHLPNPDIALANMVAACKPGGRIFMQFDPLYASPLGLHAFSFMMPYPQFLFADSLIQEKIRELGLQDLGNEMDVLQPTNKYKPSSFRRVFETSGCNVVFYSENPNPRHLNLILRFPHAFCGRGLTLEDVTTSGVTALLQKPFQAG